MYKTYLQAGSIANSFNNENRSQASGEKKYSYTIEKYFNPNVMYNLPPIRTKVPVDARCRNDTRPPYDVSRYETRGIAGRMQRLCNPYDTDHTKQYEHILSKLNANTVGSKVVSNKTAFPNVQMAGLNEKFKQQSKGICDPFLNLRDPSYRQRLQEILKTMKSENFIGNGRKNSLSLRENAANAFGNATTKDYENYGPCSSNRRRLQFLRGLETGVPSYDSQTLAKTMDMGMMGKGYEHRSVQCEKKSIGLQPDFRKSSSTSEKTATENILQEAVSKAIKKKCKNSNKLNEQSDKENILSKKKSFKKSTLKNYKNKRNAISQSRSCNQGPKKTTQSLKLICDPQCQKLKDHIEKIHKGLEFKQPYYSFCGKIGSKSRASHPFLDRRSYSTTVKPGKENKTTFMKTIDNTQILIKANKLVINCDKDNYESILNKIDKITVPKSEIEVIKELCQNEEKKIKFESEPGHKKEENIVTKDKIQHQTPNMGNEGLGMFQGICK